jgi:hypothetical protein
VNDTHFTEMFVQLPKLRVLFILRSTAMVPPLQLPASAMKEESQLMALRLVGAGVKVIPSEIGRLRATLSVLLLEENPALREIPSELGECTNLGLLVLVSDSSVYGVCVCVGRGGGKLSLTLHS